MSPARGLLVAVVITLGVVPLLVGCTSDTDSPAAEPDGPANDSEESSVDCDADLHGVFRAWEQAGFSGTVVMSTEGEVACTAGYGTADAAADTPNAVDTVFSIGSISKVFTAAAILGLVEDGQLSLSDAAGDLVHGLGGPAADVTVEQLMLHTSGLTGSHGSDHEPLDRDEAVAAIGDLEQAFEPGTDVLYSNAGYTLLALIVEERSSGGYRDHMASEVLILPSGEGVGGFWDGEPAAPGPRAVGVLDDGSPGEPGDFAGPHWALDGNGDLAMSVPDLVSWTEALFAGQVVSDESIELLGDLAVDEGEGRSMAAGWVLFDESVYGEPAFASAGGGGDTGQDVVVVWLPETQRTIAIASNTAEIIAEDLLRAIAPAFVSGDPLPTPDLGGGIVDPADLEAAAGTYELGSGGSFAVEVRTGGLGVVPEGADAFAAMFPVPDDIEAREVEDHEAAVLALLGGETQEGRDELEILESDLGPIGEIELTGTRLEDGELRTYVLLAAGAASTWAWYALDEGGGIAAVELTSAPPSLDLRPSGEGDYRPEDPTGEGPDLTVAFTDRTMTVTGPTGAATAQLVD